MLLAILATVEMGLDILAAITLLVIAADDATNGIDDGAAGAGAGGGGAGIVLVTACETAIAGFSTTFDGGTERALLLTFGSICRISTSGSLTKAPISTDACFVASVVPLMVIMRSFCDLPCFSTSICAPVAARIAFILLPARPMTREIAYVGMTIFFTDVSDVGCCCVELLRLTSFHPSSRLNVCDAFDFEVVDAVLLALISC